MNAMATDRLEARRAPERRGGVLLLELTGGTCWCNHCQQTVPAARVGTRRVCGLCTKPLTCED